MRIVLPAKSVKKLAAATNFPKAAVLLPPKVLIEANDTISVTATNYDIFFYTTLEGTVEEPGKMLCAAAHVRHFLNLFTNTTVTLSAPEITGESSDEERLGNLYVQQETYYFPILPPEECPLFPSIEDDAFTVELQSSQLIAAVNQAQFATLPTYAPMCGIHFNKVDKSLDVVATNAHHLICLTFPASTDAPDFSFTIPPAIIHYITPFLTSAPVTVSLQSGHVMFISEDFSASSVLYSQPYPDYQKLFKNLYFPYTVSIPNTTSLLPFMRRLSALLRNLGKASGQNPCLRFSMPDKDTLLLGCYTSLLNPTPVGTMELSVQADKPLPYTISLNFHYLFDFLKTFVPRSLTVYFGDSPQKPVMFLPNNSETAKYLIMPLYLPGESSASVQEGEAEVEEESEVEEEEK